MSTDDEYDLDKVGDLVELANANTVTDTAGLKRCIRDHDLVFGIWQDPESPLGVDYLIIKGMGTLARIMRTETERVSVTAVRCRCAEEAEAMRRRYGDQAARVLPLREP